MGCVGVKDGAAVSDGGSSCTGRVCIGTTEQSLSPSQQLDCFRFGQAMGKGEFGAVAGQADPAGNGIVHR